MIKELKKCVKTIFGNIFAFFGNFFAGLMVGVAVMAILFIIGFFVYLHWTLECEKECIDLGEDKITCEKMCD